MKKILVLMLLCAAFVACDKGSPTEASNCDAAPPVSLQAQVTTTGCDATTCTASFTVGAAAFLARTSWSFPGGSPAESSNFNGTVSWPRRAFPFSQDWTLQGCGCRQQDDIDGASCRSTNGRVTFTGP
jgi:hypothetical protein